jgi:hypothetical protein
LRQALAATRKKHYRRLHGIRANRPYCSTCVTPVTNKCLPLPERAEDFEITAIESAQIYDSEDRSGPFAIIAIARA